MYSSIDFSSVYYREFLPCGLCPPIACPPRFPVPFALAAGLDAIPGGGTVPPAALVARKANIIYCVDLVRIAGVGQLAGENAGVA
jgi:hypothetical protein